MLVHIHGTNQVKECEAMDKDIQKIRKSIEQRKKARGIKTDQSKGKDYLRSHALPDTEELHGYYPAFPTSTNQSKTSSSSPVAKYAVKAILSLMLFLGAAIIWESESPALNKPKAWAASALTDQFPFAKVNVWYKEVFGRPLSLTPSVVTEGDDSQPVALPVSGNISESFEANGIGIKIDPGQSTNVTAINEGVIVFAGNDTSTEKTVKVQHSDGSISHYGNLSSVDVHLYQFIQANELVGTFTPTTEEQSVFFSIEKDNHYVDPAQVIQVDDNN